MTDGGKQLRLEDRTLRLLLCLAEQPGEVRSAEQLLARVWPDVVVSPDSVYQAVTALRRQLGDDSKRPTYIATVPRRGYRLIAAVALVAAAATPDLAPAPTDGAAIRTLEQPSIAVPRPRRRSAMFAALAAMLALTVLAWQGGVLAAKPAAAQRTIAVLPLLDITDDMNEEPFADGMTEELIDKLSKVPGLAVAPPASSYYYKEKRGAVGEIGKALHVAFVLDGSVRKSGATLRVAARLMRTSDGLVVWSESYDRAWNDKLKIQQDIALEVSKALAQAPLH
ncbi:winged helix-turn-helix domain-containing protein [Massilia sp. NR 4-1]|uniref:winged helix-turn-helix domain-containing protein n=1 Tax=Massilia sp. NR 4-1 TaxID=1678028 RepID=UPI000B2DA1BD|nr:winged helix-turn-helix domain-containing protein [Massilia sp. NR 4-1]